VQAVAQAQTINELTNVGGSANAFASSHSIGSSAGSAQATAWGGSGLAAAQSTAVDAARLESFVAKASAPASTNIASVLTQANVSGQWYGAPPSATNGQAAYAFVLGKPTATTQIFDPSTAPRTAAAFAGASIEAAGILGANDDGSGGGLTTYTASTEHTFAVADNSRVILSLLDLANYGGGFSKLAFSVSDDGTTLVSDAFTNLSTAESFFTDNPLLLSRTSGPQDLTLYLQLTGDSAQGAGISYALGESSASASVPEPPTSLLLILGLLGLSPIARGRYARPHVSRESEKA
jgi:hypothetical protein